MQSRLTYEYTNNVRACHNGINCKNTEYLSTQYLFFLITGSIKSGIIRKIRGILPSPAQAITSLVLVISP